MSDDTVGRVAREKRRVWEGKQVATASGLRRSDLMENARGKIVSKRKHAQGKKMYARNADLMAAPFEGTRKKSKKSRKKSTKRAKTSRY